MKALLVDGVRGIYTPQAFAERYGDLVELIPQEDLKVLLAGPEHPNYWEVWGEMDGRMMTMSGCKWTITHEDGDVFAVREDDEHE